MIVRALDSNDVETFRALRLESLRLEPSAYASTAADWEALSLDEWRKRLGGVSIVAAFVDDEPIGMMASMRERASAAAHRATIIMVYVRLAYRGTGIAAALLQALTQRAGEAGIRQLELHVNAENDRAARFYERQGFTPIGRIPGALIHHGRAFDEILMARRIDD